MGTFGMWRAGPQRNDAVRIITGVRYLLQPPVRISAAWRSSSALAVIEPEVAEFQRIDEHIDRAYRIALRPNHQGIPATASSAGDPPLERNPSSAPAI